MRYTTPHPPQPIKYTKTKRVIVDPNVLRQRRVVMGLYNDSRADIFRILRTNILRRLRDNKWSTLGITSATPGVGKTFVTVNLAIAIALEGHQSVILVDGDLRHPSISHYFDINVDVGLIDYLRGDANLEEILINPGFERFVILPGRNYTGSHGDLIASPNMSNLLEELKSRYEGRIVLVDLPPLFVADDAVSMLSNLDCALFVAGDGESTKEELQSSFQMLEEVNLLGTILNKCADAESRPWYGYGYGYGYGQQD